MTKENSSFEIKDLNKESSKEMTRRMDAIATSCIKELEEIARSYKLKVKVEILLSDIKT